MGGAPTSGPDAPFVLALDDPAARDLERTGGKGANLARLVGAGVAVPPGFCVTTAAFRALIDEPAIRAAIESLGDLDPGADEIGARAAAVRDRIRRRWYPAAVRLAIERALADLDADAVAVRSSATAEDLPTASFAGQHETFLGVRGVTAVLDRVRDCLASLFTDRAVSYRLRHGVVHADVEMAVVVQAMVEPAVAGVLFTADPVSGNRRIASVDASYGLGDAVVAGDVTPDTARVDRQSGEVIEYTLGEKAVAVRSTPDADGTEAVAVAEAARARRVLTGDQLRALVELGAQVEALFGAPQDVEWALVGGRFVVLQSRPITALYPVPTPAPTRGELGVYLSFGHQQAMPAALPPLVVDFWRGFISRAGTRFSDRPDPLAVEAGHRVYLDLTPLLRLRPLRTLVGRAVGALNEPAADGLEALLDERASALPLRGRLASLRAIVRGLRRGRSVLRAGGPGAAAGVVRAFVGTSPRMEDHRAWFASWGAELAAAVTEPETHADRVRTAFERFDLAMVFAGFLPRLAAFPAAVLAGTALARLAPDAGDDLDAVGKGFPEEVVTRMNQRLGDLADLARDHPAVADALESGASLEALEEVDGGDAFRDAVDAFLDEFGHRATGEIDLSRPRWRDDPATPLESVRSNLARDDAGAHRAHLRRLEREAAAAADRLEARAGRGWLGPVRRRLVRRLVRTYRAGLPLREYPKQGVAHLFAAVHDVVAAAGASLAADGRLDDPDDVWFLRAAELLEALETGAPVEADVAERRRAHERFAAMRPPALLTSEGEHPSGRRPADRPGTLTGTPVSAGVVEGRALVVHDPAEAAVQAGDILVAPATDPGWTPLFLNVAGLVMEVGGRMTHGALVAREYGLPAVASVPDATTAIRTGERVRVDGTRGTVELLDRDASAEQP